VDSFQVQDPATLEVYRCPVGSDEVTPPELLGKNIPEINQVKAHDRFRLGIIIYHLIFGYHPFALGRWIGDEEQPNPDYLIQQGYWPYRKDSLLVANDLTIPIDIVHPELRDLFLKCFNDGHSDLGLRPTAMSWQRVLETSMNELAQCKAVDNHFYHSGLDSCYWCERAGRIGFDIFGSDIPRPVPSQVPTPRPVPSQVPTPRAVSSKQNKLGCLFAFLLGCIVFVVIILLASCKSENNSSEVNTELRLEYFENMD
jgi:DNA-binding helix-hairpin-helix protein with protein kinase domain